MTIVAHELKASYAFIERNFFLTRRYWGWELAFLVYSVAGALSISLIGAEQGSPTLLLTLMVGAIFWNYLSVVFSWIAETSVERWEGTLEYTFMAPVRRSSQLLGSVVVRDGLRPHPHGRDLRRPASCSSRSSTCRSANSATAVAFMLLGSFSFVGIGMIAAILPLLYVERGAQMTFVLQSCLLLVSGVYYSVDVLPRAGCRCSRGSRRRRTSSTASGPGSSTGRPVTELLGRRLAAARDGRRVHPVRAVGVRPGRALRQAHRQAEAGGLTMAGIADDRAPMPSAGTPPGPRPSRRSRPGPPARAGRGRPQGDRHRPRRRRRDRPAVVSGRFRFDALAPSDFPAVGDWVALEPTPRPAPTIRRSSPPSCRAGRAFVRSAADAQPPDAGLLADEQVIAANVDVAFLVAGLDGDFNLRRLERYLAVAWSSGVEPVVVLNKADVGRGHRGPPRRRRGDRAGRADRRRCRR